MGGLFSMIYHFFRKPKSIFPIIDEYKMKILEAEKLGKINKDPRKYKEFSALAFQEFIKSLKQLQYPQLLVNQHEQCTKLVVGGISCGKSSLINTLFGTNLEVGIGQTTKKTILAQKLNDKGTKVLIFDTPGQCDTFNTQNIDIVNSIAKSNQVFILYNSSLKRIEHLVRTIATIKPNFTILLRTQCDRFQQTFYRTLEEEIDEDKKILNKWGISYLPIYRTSSVVRDGFENRTVMAIMKSQCRKNDHSRQR